MKIKKINLLLLSILLSGCTINISINGKTPSLSTISANTSTTESSEISSISQSESSKYSSSSSSEKKDSISSSSSSSSTIIEDENTSPIKSLTAIYENTTIKLDEQVPTANFYNIEGFKSLTAKQKRVTITSSDESIVKIASTYKTFTAVSLGTVTITVTSDVDSTKSCTFNLTVEDCFFDRTVASMVSSWDVTNEMNEENPSVKIDTNNMDGIYARGSDGLKWYIETEITIHDVHPWELWSKIGIVANTFSNTIENSNNKLCFYLDAAIRDADNPNTNWTNFGVCEVSNGGSWAWNDGVGNDVARHNDAIARVETPITYEITFSMGMVRDGFNFHLYANNSYIGSIKTLETLFGNYNEEKNDGSYIPAKAMAGFFSFNSTVTFSNYEFTNIEDEVNEKIPEAPIFNENWASD